MGALIGSPRRRDLVGLEPAINRLQESLDAARIKRNSANAEALHREEVMRTAEHERNQLLEVRRQADAEINAYEMALRELTPGTRF